ncbi:MAG: amino acid ABC transporter permease, partial [Paracoccaceae bacterium]
MTAISDPPKAGFRLSMLLYDSRYRSLTIQTVALIGFLLAIGWLVNNAASNLAALGKPLGFGFLGEPASYDINQRLIEYTSRSSHLRASFVGLLNTLVVAALGCAAATIIGVFVGVLRLSHNWIVARLMTFYVEGLRNVPVLLWIVFTMAIMIEVMPPPKAFRGENPTAHMSMFDSVAVTNRGVYIPEPLFSRPLGDINVFNAFNISIELVLLLFVLALGLLARSFVKRHADRVQAETGVRPVTWWKSLCLILIPPAIVLIALGFHLGYPELKGFNFKGGIHMRNSLIALTAALSLYTAAFIAEIVRAGIQAISKGQTEAAKALGFGPTLTTRLVILPQALRV